MNVMIQRRANPPGGTGRAGFRLLVLAAVAIGLLQAACAGRRPTAVQSATPRPGFDASDFQKLIQRADCARTRNDLFLIDGNLVLWAREDRACADNGYGDTLFGATPDIVLCSSSDSVAGPRRTCEPAHDALFTTALAHLDAPDLGLGSAHTVRRIPARGASIVPVATPAPPIAAATPDLSTQAACERAGGDWGRWGIVNVEFCQVPAADAGYPCHTSDDCIWKRCITETNSVPGRCPRYQQTFGCYAEVVRGKVQPEICVD